MVLGQHEAPELRPEMAVNPVRQGRHDQLPLRRQPALAAVADRLGPQHEVLDQEVLVAPEPRAGRHASRDNPVLDRDPWHHLAAAATTMRAARRLRLARLLHAARLDPRARLQTLEAGDLLALRRHRPLKINHLALQRAHQRPQLDRGQRVRVCGRLHGPREPEPQLPGKGNPQRCHRFCPSYLLVGFVPLTILTIVVLATILLGIATPTESAAMGVVGSVILAMAYRSFTLQGLSE